MKKLKLIFAMIALPMAALTQVNQQLSNLVGPTSVNENLIPSTNATKDLGSITNAWDTAFVDRAIVMEKVRLVYDIPDNSLFLNKNGSPLNTGFGNMAFGEDAGINLTNGGYNAFFGRSAGNDNTTGAYNTFFGYSAGAYNTTGSYNTMVGMHCGLFSTTGSGNCFFGMNAAGGNSSGSDNCAFGQSALSSNDTGDENVGIGDATLFSNEAGSENIAIGSHSLFLSDGANENVAVGDDAGRSATTAAALTAIGTDAGKNVTTGGFNTFLGTRSDVTTGQGAVVNSTAIGSGALVHTSNAMSFGSTSVNRWMFGRTSMTASRALQVGTTTTNGNGASLTTGGTWTNASSRTLKSDLQKLNPFDVLANVNKLELTRWKYNDTEEYHIGPMAEQFYELFNVGVDNVSVSTIDPSGVALVAIQALSQTTEETNAEVETLKEENEKLKAQVEEMQTCIARLCELETKMNETAASQRLIHAVMPNPATERFSIVLNESSTDQQAELRIYDHSGKQVLQQTCQLSGKQILELNIAHLAAGNYTIALWVDGVIVESEKLLISK